MKNYWSITQDHAFCNYHFVLKEDQYDIELIKELLELIVISGKQFRIAKILDRENGSCYCDDYLNIFRKVLSQKKDVNNLENYYAFFRQAFPFLEKDYKNPHVIVTELAYYNLNGELVITDIFSNEVLYPLLTPHRIHLYHHLETGTRSPVSLELSILPTRELSLNISSGLQIWFPHFKPDYDLDKQCIEDFPVNDNGYIDNRELYLLNTPRLIGFIKKIRKFYQAKNGIELSNKNQLEKLPIFPNQS